MPTATSGSTVQLVINVVDANSGEVISRVTKNLDALGNTGSRAGKSMADGLNQAGTAGTRAGKQVGDGFKEMGHHALTSLDNVRLLRDDLGIRIPRGMEMAIARSKVLSAAIGGIGAALVGIGSLELAFHVGKQVYELYDKLTDINKEVRKYQEEAAKASAQSLFAASDIETQLANLKQINAEVGKLQRQQTIATDKGFAEQFRQKFAAGSNTEQALDTTGVGYLYRAGKTAYDVYGGNTKRDSRLAESLQTRDQGNERIFIQQQRATMERLKGVNAARSTGAGAVAAPGLEREAAQQAAALAMRQTQDLNNFRKTQYDTTVADLKRQMKGKGAEDISAEINKLGPKPVTDQNAGLQQYNDTSFAAQQMAAAKSAELGRKEREEVAKAQEAARSAGLEGEAKYRAALEAQQADYTRKAVAHEMTVATAHQLSAAAQEKYDTEAVERRKAQLTETERLEAESRSAGMTGLAKSDAELDRRRKAIDIGVAKTTIDPDIAERQKAADVAITAAEQKRDVDDFADHVAQANASRSDSSMTANQRILADTRRMLAELKKEYDRTYGDLEKLNPNDPRLAAGRQVLRSGQDSINQSSSDQVARNNRQLSDETRRLQLEAGRGGGGDRSGQQRLEIQIDAEDKLRAIQEREQAAARAGELDAVQQFEAQKAAIQQIANNKELDVTRSQRDKLAGELRGFFSNPLDALKRQGEDLASKAAADLLTGRRPGGAGGNGGIFDGATALFRPTFGGGKNRRFGLSGDDASHAVSAPQQAVVNAASAIIHVGSASFSGGNGAGAPSSVVSAIASGGYVSTGNGGAFNLGSSPSSSESGSAAAVAGGGAGTSAGGATLPGYTESSSDAAARIFGSAQSGISQANSMGKDLGIFGKDADGNNAGLASKIPGIKNMNSEQLGKLGGTAGGLLGVYSAFQGKGGFGGAATGALSGAQVGMQYGGILGGAIGAIAGGVLGFIGHGARVEAQKYYFKELMPKLEQDMLGFEAGTVAYQSAYDDFTSSDSEAKARTRQMGSGAVGYYNDRIHPDIVKYQQRLTREQKAGRSQFGMSAAQFHMGGPIGGFGSMATSPTEGWVHAQRGEVMLNQQAAMSHMDVAMMMNSGTSRSDIAAYMGGDAPQQRAVEGDGGDVHLHVHTMDVKGVRDFLSTYKHDVRSAVNSSYAENSGGGD